VLVLVLLLGACGNDPSLPRGHLVAEPVGANDVHLGDLPRVGVVVGSSDAVVLLDLDGTILATLDGYEVGGNIGAQGVWLKRGPKYFKLDVAHGLLVPVGEDRARDVMYDEGAQPSLPPPPGSAGPNGETAGHWRYAIESGSGVTLAQWSGECEVPTAYWIDEDGTIRIVTGESDVSTAPESVALGWTPNGRAVVSLSRGGCGASAESPGVYLYSSPGVGRLVYPTADRTSADVWGFEL
jgi:hypothetical protein